MGGSSSGGGGGGSFAGASSAGAGGSAGGRGAYKMVHAKKGSPCAICGAENSWCGFYRDGTDHVLCMVYHRDGVACPPGFKAIGGMGKSGGQRFGPTDATGALVRGQFDAAWRDKQAKRDRDAEGFRRAAIASANGIWANARPLEPGSVELERVAGYFAARGVDVSHLPGGRFSTCIRLAVNHPHFNPETKVNSAFDAVVCLLVQADGAKTGVQRIYLDQNGWGKAAAAGDHAKLEKGSCTSAACRLLSVPESGVLILCEGIETGHALQAAFGDQAAVWCLVSSSGMYSVDLPAELCKPGGRVKTVVVAADHDRIPRKSKVRERPGMTAANIAANVIKRKYAHLRVGVACPSSPAIVGELVEASAEEDGVHEVAGVRDAEGSAKSVDWLDVYAKFGAQRVREGVMGTGVVWREELAPDVGEVESGGVGSPPDPPEQTQEQPVQDAPKRKYIEDLPAKYGVEGDREARALEVLMARFAPPVEHRADSTFYLAYHGGQFMEWVPPELDEPRWRMVDTKILHAEATHVLDAFKVELRRGYANFNPTNQEISNALTSSTSYIAVMEERAPCWLPPAFRADGMPIVDQGLHQRWAAQRRTNHATRSTQKTKGAVIAARNGLLAVEDLVEGRFVMRPPTPRFFTLTCMPWDIDCELLKRGAAAEDPYHGIFHIVDEEGLAPNFLRVLRHASGMAACEEEAEKRGMSPEAFAAWANRIEAQNWIDGILEIGGCMLLGWNPFEICGVLDGVPGSGKDVILDGFGAAVGEHNTASVSWPTLCGRFDMMGLLGKPFLRMSEMRVSGNRGDNEASMDNLLRITTNVPIRTEGKHVNARMYDLISGVVFMAINGWPKSLRDDSGAIVRRLRIFPVRPFTGTPDPHLKSKVQAEGMGIFLLLMEGLRRAMRRGSVVEPRSGMEARDEVMRGLSPIRAFTDDCCVVGEGNGVPRDVLIETFRRWAKKQGYTGMEIMNKQSFGQGLRTAVKGYVEIDRGQRGTGQRVNYYMGIRLTDDDDYELVGDGLKKAERRKAQLKPHEQDAVPARHAANSKDEPPAGF